MSTPRLPLAVSLGDPAGIGPELIARLWWERQERLRDCLPFFVVGGERALDTILRAQHGAGAGCIAEISNPGEALEVFDERLPVIASDPVEHSPGNPDERGAALALHSLAGATRFALLGQAAGIVTAPVSKEQLAKVGFEFPGQTEFLAEVCGLQSEDAVMMLAGPSLRAVPLTVHVALSDVPALLSTDMIARKGRIVAAALKRDFGVENPRLAVCGLNPHAGEGGKFGSEEARVIEPAIEALRADGIDVSGPHSADGLFASRGRENFDAALCMYHDQALIPVKALDFDEGVNVTLGLPIIRTSPDHGTAFDIAGKGIADPGAMRAAIRMASACAAKRAANG